MNPTAAPALPDFNFETNPFPLVEYLLNQAAYLNLFSVPAPGSGQPITGPGGIVGFTVDENWHRFSIALENPSVRHGVRASNLTGERLATMRHRWLFAPADFDAHPGELPPPTPFDPSREQRFVMLDSVCTFGSGADSFRAFGTGRTIPMTLGGKPHLLAGAVGAIMSGTGQFEGITGLYSYCGSWVEGQGFRGNVIVRAVDPSRKILSDGSLRPIESGTDADPEFTYIAFRSQKSGASQKTSFRFGPSGQPVGLLLDPELRVYDVDCGFSRNSLRAVSQTGQQIGRMTADIAFNLLNPGGEGSDTAPIPFSNIDVYTFKSPEGVEVGGLTGNGSEGRVVRMLLPAPKPQQSLRFAGFGPLENGFGAFAGVQGMMAHNSGVGVQPHALATIFLCRIYDPGRRYRIG